MHNNRDMSCDFNKKIDHKNTKKKNIRAVVLELCLHSYNKNETTLNCPKAHINGNPCILSKKKCGIREEQNTARVDQDFYEKNM